MKNKLLKEYRNFEICEPVTICGPRIPGIFEARIITTLFQGNTAVESLTSYYN